MYVDGDQIYGASTDLCGFRLTFASNDCYTGRYSERVSEDMYCNEYVEFEFF